MESNGAEWSGTRRPLRLYQYQAKMSLSLRIAKKEKKKKNSYPKIKKIK